MGKGIVDMASHFETVQTELGTVLQDAEKGAKLFEDLRKFSFDTTFGVDELADASKQLLNAGESVSSLNSELKMLGDLAGGSKQKFAELTSIYSKVLTTGRATSIQLQQFNLRGIPITKTLKEMGVTGVASAEQLQQAFKKLTEEGGQFHNAMDNIINTIEGKRGFITDTIKEIQVNLGEVTGLTDLYKKSLDVIYEVLNGFNNLLMKINENPLVKSLVSGVLTTVITGLVTIIGGGLFNALGNVIKSLAKIAGLKAIISSPVGWIALGVAGIAGAITGIVKYKNAQKELQEQAQKTKDAIQAELDLINQPKTTGSQLEFAQDMVKTLETTLKDLKTKLADANEQLDELRGKKHKKGAYKELKNELGVADLESGIERATESLKIWNEQVAYYEGLVGKGKEINELSTQFETIFGNTDLGKKQKEINSILADIKTLKDYLSKDGTMTDNGLFSLTPSKKQQINETIKYLEEKLDELYGKEKKKNWWEIFTEVTGVGVEKNAKGVIKGAFMGSTYRTNLMNDYYNTSARNKAMGIPTDNAELAQNFIDKITEDINTLLSSGYNLYDNSIMEMIDGISYFKNIIDETSDNTEKLNDKLSFLTEYSQDLSNFMNGFDEGGVYGGIISVLFKSFMSVASSCENFDKVLNPISMGMEHLRPTIQLMVNTLIPLEEVVEGIFECLETTLELLRPLLLLIEAINKVIATVVKSILYVVNQLLKLIGKLFKVDDLSQSIQNFIDQLDESTGFMNDELKINQYELTKSTKDLTNEYQSLLKAMQDQEEWYLKEKSKLNSDQYKINYNKVNDMILTPQGNFSTHPDDYIIATKNPSGLGGNVVINDYAGVNVATDNMNGNLYVTLSKRIADDVANGANGWDNALVQQSVRMAGRRIRI